MVLCWGSVVCCSPSGWEGCTANPLLMMAIADITKFSGSEDYGQDRDLLGFLLVWSWVGKIWQDANWMNNLIVLEEMM